MRSRSSWIIFPCAVFLVGCLFLRRPCRNSSSLLYARPEARSSFKPFRQRVNAPTQTDTAFFNAMTQGDSSKAEALLKKGADIDTRDPWQRTFLISFAMAGDAETVTWLLDRGASINAVDNGKMSALFHAVLTTSSSGCSAVEAQCGLAHSKLRRSDSLGQSQEARPRDAAPERDRRPVCQGWSSSNRGL